MTKQGIAVRESEALPAGAITPMDMISQAIASGAGVEQLGKLMELQERWEKNQARKAFDNAMSNAKAEIPVIIKTRTVDFTSQKGRTTYNHEDLPGIARIVDPILSKFGLSYRYRTSVKEGGQVEVVCVISHKDGHSEETSLTAGRDDSGSKNNLQAVGSTITYLQRYTLKAALGLSASDDDDGVAAGGNGPSGPITDDQAAHLISICDEIDADKRAFCEYFGVEGIAMLPASKYDRAIAMLEKKRAKDKGKAKEPAQ